MKLSRKINLVLLLIFTLFIVGGIALNEKYARMQTSKKVLNRIGYLIGVSKVDADQIVTNLLLKQNDGVSLYLERIKANEALSAISIISDEQYDEDKQRHKCIEAYVKSSMCVTDTNDLYVLYTQLKYGNSTYGYLKKVFAIQPEEIFSVAQMIKILLLLVPLLCTVFIAVSWMLKRIIVKPIDDICCRIQPLRKGDFNISLSPQKTEELKHLTDSIDDISRELKVNQDEKVRNSNLASIGLTTSMIAHDIRRPLSSMKALLSTIPEIKHDSEQLKQMMTAVDSSISRTNNLLNDILEFSKDESALKITKNDPQSFISAALSDVLRALPGLDVNITYSLKHKNSLLVDSTRMMRVLVNIVGNALEAMKGGGNLWFKTNDLINTDLGHRMLLIVGNDGPLIPEEIQDKLCDPFFSHGKKGGTGLGLAICKKIIDLHGGTISISSCKVQNTSSVKTEFIINLPATEDRLYIREAELIRHSDEMTAFFRESEARDEFGDTANISEFMKYHKMHDHPFYLLIVDDEPLFRETFRAMLSSIQQIKDHVRIIEADSAEIALRQFEAREFDYVVTDIDMGKNQMNGYEFATRILKKYKKSYVLIHSNKRCGEMDTGVRQIRSSKFMGFLPKPISKSDMLQFLSRKTFEIGGSDKLALSKLSKCILILNDDDALLASFSIVLRRHVDSILLAEDYDSAVNQYLGNNVDLIISDINLDSDKDGYDFLEYIRSKNEHIPFFMVSGFSKKEEESKSKERGANGYLQLPLEKNELMNLIHNAFN